MRSLSASAAAVSGPGCWPDDDCGGTPAGDAESSWDGSAAGNCASEEATSAMAEASEITEVVSFV